VPVAPTYPGVYIEEIPSGVHTITGVATSIAAFIDYFTMGPMNQAVLVLNFGDFQRVFGGLNALSEASYAIQQFFLNGGSEAWVVRVASTDPGPPNAPTKAVIEISDTIAGAVALTVTAISEGTWGNSLRVKLDTNGTAAGQFNLTVSQYQTQGGISVVVRQEVFRNLSMVTTDPNYVQTVVNDANTGSNLVRVTANTALTPLRNGTVSAAIVNPTSIAVPLNPTATIQIGSVTSSSITIPLVAGNYPLTTLAPLLEEAIRAAVPTNPEFSGATVSIIGGNQLSILAGAGNPADMVSFPAGTMIPALDLQGGTATPNVQEYPLGVQAAVANSAQIGGTPGQDGVPPNATELIGSLAAKTGIFALENVDLFNLLCIPRTAITSGLNNPLSATSAQAVMTVAEQYCESRRAFFLMDTPLGISKPTAIQGWLAGNNTLRDNNAALYFPRVDVPDPLNSFRLRSFGPSGTIAGLCARIDSARGVWKAPAGTEGTLVNVPQLDYSLTDGENGVLNPLAINCLRNFPVYGNVCWGARTLEGADQIASDWKYIPVRRFALFLEESLYRGTKWAVFEPNDEPLWAQIRLNLGAFMQSLFRQGAFQGSSPRDAYFVKCDKETTTQTDINNGIVNIVVGFAPLKPAEFVILKIQQIAGQIPT
jgi:Bacteriophage tail sheath protein